MQNVNTGSYIAIAGLIVSGLSYFGIVLSQDAIVTIIAGGVALYGIIHQYVVSRKVANVAKSAGLI